MTDPFFRYPATRDPTSLPTHPTHEAHASARSASSPRLLLSAALHRRWQRRQRFDRTSCTNEPHLAILHQERPQRSSIKRSTRIRDANRVRSERRPDTWGRGSNGSWSVPPVTTRTSMERASAPNAEHRCLQPCPKKIRSSDRSSAVVIESSVFLAKAAWDASTPPNNRWARRYAKQP